MRPGYLNGVETYRPRHTFSGVFDKITGGGKGESAEMPEPPEPPEPADVETPPETIEDYAQDSKCPEGQKSTPCQGADCPTKPSCEADPIFEKLKLQEAEKQLEQELLEAKRQAEEAQRVAAREEARQQQDLARIQKSEALQIQRKEEEATMQNFLIFGIGGLGLFSILALLFKFIRR